MNTEALIRELAERVEPVEPLSRPLVRSGWWLGAAALWVGLVVAIVGVRSDLAAVVCTSEFVVQLLLPLALGAAAAIAALAISIPDRRKRWPAAVPAGIIATWLLLLLFEALSNDGGQLGVGLKCLRNLIVLSVPPAILLYVMIKRATPLERGAAGLLAALAAGSFAQVGTRFVCHNGGALHVLVWHVAFVLLLGGFGVLAGRRIFR